MIKKFIALVLATAGLTAILVACKEDSGKPIPSTPTITQTQVLTPMEQLAGLLDSYGVYYSSAEAAAKMAQTICESREEYSEEFVRMMLYATKSEGDYQYTNQDVDNLYEAATTVYCPQFS